eukprot:1462100-Pyramimonas_sp.AAC.1
MLTDPELVEDGRKNLDHPLGHEDTGSSCIGHIIEDAYSESPPPPALVEAPMWLTTGLEPGQASGPVVPRVGLESLRGTRGGARGLKAFMCPSVVARALPSCRTMCSPN